MQERTYKPYGDSHSITVGKTTFIVSSFTDTQATATSGPNPQAGAFA